MEKEGVQRKTTAQWIARIAVAVIIIAGIMFLVNIYTPSKVCITRTISPLSDSVALVKITVEMPKVDRPNSLFIEEQLPIGTAAANILPKPFSYDSSARKVSWFLWRGGIPVDNGPLIYTINNLSASSGVTGKVHFASDRDDPSKGYSEIVLPSNVRTCI